MALPVCVWRPVADSLAAATVGERRPVFQRTRRRSRATVWSIQTSSIWATSRACVGGCMLVTKPRFLLARRSDTMVRQEASALQSIFRRVLTEFTRVLTSDISMREYPSACSVLPPAHRLGFRPTLAPPRRTPRRPPSVMHEQGRHIHQCHTSREDCTHVVTLHVAHHRKMRPTGATLALWAPASLQDALFAHRGDVRRRACGPGTATARAS